MTVKYEFVEFIPDELAADTLYISIPHLTAMHSCMCGCGEEIVTPISPTDWHLTFDGESVSLYPSVGSWNLPCKSHYWIEKNEVVWAERWSEEQIEAGRRAEKLAKDRYYAKPVQDAPREEMQRRWWERIRSWFR